MSTLIKYPCITKSEVAMRIVHKYKKKFLRAGFEPATYGLLKLIIPLQSTALPTELPEEMK